MLCVVRRASCTVRCVLEVLCVLKRGSLMTDDKVMVVNLANDRPLGVRWRSRWALCVRACVHAFILAV